MNRPIVYLRKDGHPVRRLVGPHAERLAARYIELKGYERFDPADPGATAPEASSGTAPPHPYATLTVAELREELAARGLEAPARAKKDDLIAILEGAGQDGGAGHQDTGDDASAARQETPDGHDAGAALAGAAEDAAGEA